MMTSIADLSTILLILQITIFVALGVALAAEDAADGAWPQHLRHRYCDSLLVGAGVVTLCNIAIRLV
jgi:hypothetical protein